MKKGKILTIKAFKDVKCFYGTVDSKDLKSIYVILQSWVEPTTEIENWERVVKILERKIKHLILETTDRLLFERHAIVDLDLRSSGIKLGKRSFMNLELTLYLKEPVDFRSFILKEKIKDIVKTIYINTLDNTDYFTLNISKKTVKQ